MDGRHFDDLTRALAGGTSRRSVLRGLAGFAAGLLGLGGANGAFAACRPAGRRCTAGGSCCSGLCDPATMTCVCPPGTENCRGNCLDPATYQTDPTNCGVCDTRCQAIPNATAVCAGGACDVVCNGGFHRCGGACVPTTACCIGDAQIAAGTRNPANQCQACQPAVSLTAYSNLPGGTGCNDNNACTQTDACDGAGACVGGNPKSCSGVADPCNDGVCRQSDGQCVKQPKANGASCETGNKCTADTCQGGVCTQGPVNVSCPTPTACQASVSCNPASGACDQVVNKGSGTACGTGPTCTGGSQKAQDRCNGSGACVPGATTPCGAYVCGATACRTTCESDDHCVGSAHCDGETCQGDKANGAGCDEASDCVSGICNPTNHVCCSQNCAAGVACTEAGDACAPVCSCAGKTCGDDGCGISCGTCGPNQTCTASGQCEGTIENGQPCTASEQCQSGICNATNHVCCSQACGPGVACTGGTTCDTDPTCGGPGQPCCGVATDNSCDSGACSGNFLCEPCGTEAFQVCCVNDANIFSCTTPGLGCTDRLCWPIECGGTNEPCCDGTRCQNGRLCDEGQVCRVQCGGIGQPCCAGGICNAGGICFGPTCIFCGGPNQACCAGEVCNAGLECGVSFSGTGTQCVASCSGDGEVCCRVGGNPVCDAGLDCKVDARCGSCGSQGQGCCYRNGCDAGVECSINLMCEPCGELNQPCCFNDANISFCASGLACRDRTCQP